MGRQRTSEIQESLTRLYELERGLADHPEYNRIRMLRLMKENPKQSIAEIAATVGCGQSTIERWWGEYRNGGINQLLQVQPRGGNRLARLDKDQVQLLAQKVEQHELTSYSAIQQWIRSEFGVDYSMAGVRHLVSTKIGRIERIRKQKGAKQKVSASDTALASTRFLRFLNTLPVAGESGAWVREFQKMFPELFPDIDKVLVAVNYQVRFSDVEMARKEPIQVVLSWHARQDSDKEKVLQVGTTAVENQQAERILGMMSKNNFPLHLYYPPPSFEYYYNGEYVGVLILFRSIERAPISKATLETIKSLQPFITFIFAHLVMRERYFKPTDALFYSSLDTLLEETGLSNQQLRIVAHLLLGRAYKEIADQMSIAEGTVKKQVSNIYKKTGIRSHNELFAKYFTPHFDD